MKARASSRIFRQRAYAMKKHFATRLHYDLRLEWNGVLLSWALPEGPDCHAGVICNAIEMEDHRREYLQFQGVHKTGIIMLWDRGTWELHPESEDVESSLSRGILRFILHGEKLKGAWTLTKTNIDRNTRSIWTLCKHDDAFAKACSCRSILKEQPNSVTGETAEEISQNWITPRNKHERQSRLFDR